MRELDPHPLSTSIREGKTQCTPSFISQLFDDSIEITPAVDDRMFVCCCILDNEYATRVKDVCSRDVIFDLQKLQEATQDPKKAQNKGHNKEDEAGSASSEQQSNTLGDDWSTAKNLYETINIDLPGGCSCQSGDMMRKTLDEQLYTRWLEYGSIHSITNHSLVLITSRSSGVLWPVINPFLTEYVQLACLALVQRASLIHFDSRLSDLFSKKGRLSDLFSKKERKSDDIVQIADDYSTFQAQLLIPEPTHQIQGIEIYEQLQKMLFIDRLSTNVKEQIELKFQTTDVRHGNYFNILATFFAIVALLIELAPNAFEYSSCKAPESGQLPFHEMTFSVFLLNILLSPKGIIVIASPFILLTIYHFCRIASRRISPTILKKIGLFFQHSFILVSLLAVVLVFILSVPLPHFLK